MLEYYSEDYSGKTKLTMINKKKITQTHELPKPKVADSNPGTKSQPGLLQSEAAELTGAEL